jgi:hypothetical protein
MVAHTHTALWWSTAHAHACARLLTNRLQNKATRHLQGWGLTVLPTASLLAPLLALSFVLWHRLHRGCTFLGADDTSTRYKRHAAHHVVHRANHDHKGLEHGRRELAD